MLVQSQTVVRVKTTANWLGLMSVWEAKLGVNAREESEVKSLAPASTRLKSERFSRQVSFWKNLT